jgi:hypothetical protein
VAGPLDHSNLDIAMPESAQFRQSNWLFAKRVGIINGLLALVGISVASYVYFNFPIPTEIVRHGLDKFGRPLEPENAVLHLFVLPIFQVVLAVVPVWGVWRVTHGTAEELAQREARWRDRYPRPVASSSQPNWLGVIVPVLFQVGMFIATIVRAVSAALGTT